MKSESGEKGGPAKRGRKNRQAPQTLEDRAVKILKDLKELSRDMGEEYGLIRAESFPVDSIVLPVTIAMDGRPLTSVTHAEATRLVRDLNSRVTEAVKALTAFRQGCVYCFQCDAPDCSHAVPDDPDKTFSGYTATGKPVWRTFLNLCMEWKDPRVEKLYGDAPEVFAVVQKASELKGELLPAFGKGSLAFNVLGQAIAGLVPRNLRIPGREEDRFALTIQFVETRSGTEKRRLRLNILGVGPDEIAEADEHGGPNNRAGRLRHTIRITRQRLNSIGRELARAEQGGRRIDLEGKVNPLLHRLRGDLDRIFRLDRRRTRHAAQRHEEKERPTGVAMKDARGASAEKLLLDVRKNTVVALGPKQRAHVFSRAGMHVTSLQLDHGEIDRKVGKKRWRPLTDDEVAEFRSAIKETT